MFDNAPYWATVDHGGQAADALDVKTTLTLKRILIRLASDLDSAAASEAAQVPYWKACPDSVRGRRAAARALRATADSLAVRTS